MNIERLQARLQETQIPSQVYHLTGGLPNEAYCIGQQGTHWEVYYSERGKKTGLQTFETESEACQYFWDWIIKEVL